MFFKCLFNKMVFCCLPFSFLCFFSPSAFRKSPTKIVVAVFNFSVRFFFPFFSWAHSLASHTQTASPSPSFEHRLAKHMTLYCSKYAGQKYQGKNKQKWNLSKMKKIFPDGVIIFCLREKHVFVVHIKTDSGIHKAFHTLYFFTFISVYNMSSFGHVCNCARVKYEKRTNIFFILFFLCQICFSSFFISLKSAFPFKIIIKKTKYILSGCWCCCAVCACTSNERKRKNKQ